VTFYLEIGGVSNAKNSRTAQSLLVFGLIAVILATYGESSMSTETDESVETAQVEAAEESAEASAEMEQSEEDGLDIVAAAATLGAKRHCGSGRRGGDPDRTPGRGAVLLRQVDRQVQFETHLRTQGTLKKRILRYAPDVSRWTLD
jgi:hypothetical protein